MNPPAAPAGMGFVYGLCHHALGALHGMLFPGEITGVGHLPRRGPFLIAANHASFLDPPFIGCHVPRQMAFFARKSLWKGGAASWWLDTVGCIPVDRDGSDVAAIKNVLRALQAGRPLVLFPEGTRSPDGTLQPPKAGVGLIACRAQVPVVPARIFNSHLALGRSGPPRFGTSVAIVYGPPLAPADFDDPADGKERYARASERIMAAIAALHRPAGRVL